MQAKLSARSWKSIRKACKILNLQRTTLRYQSRRVDDDEVRAEAMQLVSCPS